MKQKKKGDRGKCVPWLAAASRRFSASVVSTLPNVGDFSSMKLRSPVRMVATDHAGFQVSG